MTFHASLYSATPQLDAWALLLDVSSTGLGDRNDLQQGSLAIRKEFAEMSMRQSLTLSWPAHFALMSATHALATGFACSARTAE
jgi:hypothetical protein